jgi:hypothetical protein
MCNALGLTTRSVSTISDNAEKILKSAKSGTKAKAIKISHSRIWITKCKKNVSRT